MQTVDAIEAANRITAAAQKASQLDDRALFIGCIAGLVAIGLIALRWLVKQFMSDRERILISLEKLMEKNETLHGQRQVENAAFAKVMEASNSSREQLAFAVSASTAGLARNTEVLLLVKDKLKNA